MAQLNTAFNPNEHEEMADFSVIPAGKYVAHIVKSEIKPTKNKLGAYLQLEFDLDTPGFSGRKVWTRLNIQNPNDKAVEIAYRELTSICNATGIKGDLTDTNVLHGKPMIIKLKVVPATSQYSESNEIVAYESTGNMGSQQTIPGMEAGPETAAQEPASADMTPPWAS